MPPDATPRSLLTTFCRLTVVGASRHTHKDAHTVPAFMQAHGWDVVPVNPHADGELLGVPCYPTITAAPGPHEIVAVFRPGPQTPPFVREAIDAGAEAIWLPTGVRSAESRALAEEAGVPYVEDVCLRVTHQRVFGTDGMRRDGES